MNMFALICINKLNFQLQCAQCNKIRRTYLQICWAFPLNTNQYVSCKNVHCSHIGRICRLLCADTLTIILNIHFSNFERWAICRVCAGMLTILGNMHFSNLAVSAEYHYMQIHWLSLWAYILFSNFDRICRVSLHADTLTIIVNIYFSQILSVSAGMFTILVNVHFSNLMSVSTESITLCRYIDYHYVNVHF